jgi:hypothetical protein
MFERQFACWGELGKLGAAVSSGKRPATWQNGVRRD